MGKYPEKDEEIEAFKRRRKRSLILTGIAAVSAVIGISSVAAYACSKWDETRREMLSAIEQENAEEKRQQLEEIVSEVKTPEEAFARTSADIVFIPGNDTNIYGADTWNSLLNTYAIKKGDCDDGAIAFAAMLSDNPDYEVKLVYLRRDPALKETYLKMDPPVKEPDHVMAVYRDNNLGTWGYVSFNEGVDTIVSPVVGYSKMENPLYGSIDKAVREYNDGSFVAYQIIDFTAEELKFGTGLTRKFDSSAAVQLR